jgi:hypothetical protein
MMISETTMASTADFATVLPKLGPIDSSLGSPRNPKAAFSFASAWSIRPGPSCLLEICTTCGPRSLFCSVWMCASASPSGASVLRTSSTLAGFCSEAVIRVPPSKSMPKLIPLAEIASAPISRIVPDMEKNHLALPM